MRRLERLEDHPNLRQILGVLAQLAQVGDDDLGNLAAQWRNTAAVAAARDRALSPDSPLVLEVLNAFDALASLFEDDLRGEATYVCVDPAVTAIALKAVRDAIAAAYARPVLSISEHAVLMRPWRSVYPVSTVEEPDLGPQAEALKGLLSVLPRLASRCHDEEAAEVFQLLVRQSFHFEADRVHAREEAFQAAVLTSRRRTWALVRRSAAEGLSRPCVSCASSVDDGGLPRVLALCLDAACVLLVTDAVPDALVVLLTAPLEQLIPLQRRG